MKPRKNRKAKVKKPVTKNKGGRKKGTKGAMSFFFTGENGIRYLLTQKQRLFCESFVESAGNGVDAVIEAGYECFYPKSKIPNRRVAKVIACENLKKPHLIAYISKLLEDTGLNDATVDKHWLFTIEQFADLGAKNRAIDMYNKRKGRYKPEEYKHTIETVEVVEYDKQD